MSPIPRLHQARGIEGYLTADLEGICFDQRLLESSNRGRYRFTLAHEVGHLALHKELFKTFHDDGEWKEWHKKLVTHQISGAEYQANVFAGLVLMPPVELSKQCWAIIDGLGTREKLKPLLAELGLHAFWYHVSTKLADVFHVAQVTAEIRLKADSFWESDPTQTPG